MPQVTVRAFASLSEFFKERGWEQPYTVVVPEQLLAILAIPAGRVEAVFVNGKVTDLTYELQEGDRLGLVPPGTPGPYRVLLGFVKGSATTPGEGAGGK